MQARYLDASKADEPSRGVHQFIRKPESRGGASSAFKCGKAEHGSISSGRCCVLGVNKEKNIG